MPVLFASLLLTFVCQPEAATASSGKAHSAHAGRGADTQQRLICAITGQGLEHPRASAEASTGDREPQARLVSSILGSDLEYPTAAHRAAGTTDVQTGIISSITGR